MEDVLGHLKPAAQCFSDFMPRFILASIGTELRTGFDPLLICSCRFTVLIK
jgi:hypothetical protein